MFYLKYDNLKAEEIDAVYLLNEFRVMYVNLMNI